MNEGSGPGNLQKKWKGIKGTLAKSQTLGGGPEFKVVGGGVYLVGVFVWGWYYWGGRTTRHGTTRSTKTLPKRMYKGMGGKGGGGG